MRLRFGVFTLDTARAELLGPDGLVPIEPKPLALLTYLAENNDRVVSRDDMIEAVWGGRIVSDAAVSTVLKQVRKALGDGGRVQQYIRTIHGVGHRFVAETVVFAASPVSEKPLDKAQADGRPVLAVLPFTASGTADGWAILPEAIAAEIIASLSRLRWLKVIARETTFRFRNPAVDLDGIRITIGAGYVLSGVVEMLLGRLAISLELLETGNGSVIWAERFIGRLEDVHEVRIAIVGSVLSALEITLPQREAELARSRSTESLGAWSSFHLGLAHVYRFNRKDNALAAGLFRRATDLDPGFAAGWAARSFASYQEAAMGFVPDRRAAVRDAREAAERSIELDPTEPTANFAMGRLPILAGALGDDTGWLDRAVELSPSFAKGHYARAMVDALSGRSGASREGIDRAIQLSPLDPLLGPMFGIRALALLTEGQLEEAREQAMRSVRAGPTHMIGVMQAAAISLLAGRSDEAVSLAERVRDGRPGATVELYLSALPIVDGPARDQVIGALLKLGFARS